ncbi:hypothetical protein TRVA0_081S00166 [Trichomonascus vanleenenianus]|uniref:Xbp1p n=1 Tax=Trichomonascus vanleenenianus TaxID=2268995 RepID=UPI003EC9B301
MNTSPSPLKPRLRASISGPPNQSGVSGGKHSSLSNASLLRSYTINYPIQEVPGDMHVPPEQAPLIPAPSSIVMKKYATSVDERNFLTVYEYMVNNQWVIWDYFTGYVHLTGLWKAIGNSKADIVKLVDNSPDLEPVIRRVRGGFLKIQGTWLPFNVARALASRTCFHIRYALVPIFGAAFPDSCLKPGEPGFGQLQLNLVDPTRRRRKRTAAAALEGGGGAHPGTAAAAKRRKSDAVAIAPATARLHRPGASRPMSESRRNTIAGSMYLGRMAPLPRLEAPDECVIESPSSSSEDEEMQRRARAMRRPRAKTFSYISPPPLPEKVNFADEVKLANSPHEFLEVLQATRSLQQISAGSAGRRWSFDQSALGGGFECAGRLWRWDGNQNLNVVGYREPFTTSTNVPRTIPTKDYPQDMKPDLDNDHQPRKSIMDISGLLT